MFEFSSVRVSSPVLGFWAVARGGGQSCSLMVFRGGRGMFIAKGGGGRGPGHEALSFTGFRGTRIIKGGGTIIFPMVE